MPNCTKPKTSIRGFKQPFCSLVCANAFGHLTNLNGGDFCSGPLIEHNYLSELALNPQPYNLNNGSQTFKPNITNFEPSRGRTEFSTHLLPEFMQQQIQQQQQQIQQQQHPQQQPEQQQPENKPQLGPPHQFGKVTSMDLMKFYENSPTVDKNLQNSTQSLQPHKYDIPTLQTYEYDRRSPSPTRDYNLLRTPRKNLGANLTFFNNFTTPLNNNNNGSPGMTDSNFEKCSLANCSNKKSKNFGPGFPFCGVKCMNLAQTINQRTQLLD